MLSNETLPEPTKTYEGRMDLAVAYSFRVSKTRVYDSCKAMEFTDISESEV
jgi:hypothetical protein